MADLTCQERAAKIQVHEKKKTNLCWSSFRAGRLIKVGRDFVTLGRIDGKRVYFLEQRDCFGGLDKSTTFTSLTTLKKSIRNR